MGHSIAKRLSIIKNDISLRELICLQDWNAILGSMAIYKDMEVGWWRNVMHVYIALDLLCASILLTFLPSNHP